MKIKDVTYARAVCTIREMKKDKHRTRTKAGSSDAKREGDAGTPAAHL